jgi:hypothetical protein
VSTLVVSLANGPIFVIGIAAAVGVLLLVASGVPRTVLARRGG